MKRSGMVTLLTDFGLKDPYVGMMKGVILTVNPAARIIDISHHVKAGAIGQAAHILRETYPYFPKGTVHVTVVDPGVGSKRRAIIVMAQSHLFVGPDNGMFWPIIDLHQNIKIIHITETKYFLRDVSETFHGRDIFAPVAAHLSMGADPFEMGTAISDPVKLQLPAPHQEGNTLYGEIVHVDHFGNLITNIHRKEIERFIGNSRPVIGLGDLIIEGMRRTYAEAIPGEALALIGSSDNLEIAVNLGRADNKLGLDLKRIVGMEVKVIKG